MSALPVGKVIREIRERRGLSKRRLERMSHVSGGYLTRVEEYGQIPRHARMTRIAKALKVPELIPGFSEMNKPESRSLIPLSDIVIYFQEHYNHGKSVPKSCLRKFSDMDLEMLVDMGILFSYMDHFHGQRMYRLRRPRTTSTGTKMVYSQRVQYAKDWHQKQKVAA